jgi:DNA mismatch repair protein MutS
VDVSTGDFRATETSEFDDLVDELSRISPREILLPNRLKDYLPLKRIKEQLEIGGRPIFTFIDDEFFNPDVCREVLIKKLGYEDTEDALSCLNVAINAAGVILRYLEINKSSQHGHIRRLIPYKHTDYMVIDDVSRTNLELIRTIATRQRTGSLLSVMDCTCTPMGSRLLLSWLNYPLIDIGSINERLDAVQELLKKPTLRRELRNTLKKISDIERLNAKCATLQCNPREMLNLSKSLVAIPAVRELLKGCESVMLKEIYQKLDDVDEVSKLITQSLNEDPPIEIKSGGIFRRGYNSELDKLMDITRDGRTWILSYETEERQRTGIPNLKAKYNKVFGYYIEVTKSHLGSIPSDYSRKQTIAGGERFTTERLKDYEQKILTAEQRMAVLEYEMFVNLRSLVSSYASRIKESAGLLARCDVICSFAEIASKNRYCRPLLTTVEEIVIKEGRHPVLERVHLGEPFIPNDISMNSSSHQMLIITGPNMAGKSTLLRQVALTIIMAQMGSFVPAKEAKIGLVDRIFTRVGALDNLSAGQSTFMVEMIETSNILKYATRKSFILLDEVGRGTSTFDGVSIAWAVAEYIHDRIRARTLFATHYHELTGLAQGKRRAKNFSISVKEWNDRIIFLRKLVKGPTDRSYGIQVGKLAGLPEPVIKRAKEVLSFLEKGEVERLIPQTKIAGLDSMLFNPEFLTREKSRRIERQLRSIDLDRITPEQALKCLQRLREMV